MRVTANEVTIIKATIIGKSNDYIKAEFYLVNVNHVKLFPVATK